MAVGPLSFIAAVLMVPGAASSGPTFAAQWSAKLVYNGVMVNMNFTDGHGSIYYDRIGQRHRTTVRSPVTLFEPNGSMWQDQLYKNISGTTGNFTIGARAEDGVCLPFGERYLDLFGWLSGAKRNGSKFINGERCEVWTHKMYEDDVLGNMTTINTACLGADGVPREFKKVSYNRKGSMDEHYLMSEVKIGNPGDEAFENSVACATNYPSKPCVADSVSTLDLYRIFGPPEPMELANRNTGDALGDLSFLCTQGSGEAYRSKLITHWSVKVREDYGQYALCNFNGTDNLCSGDPDMLLHVGRRSSQMQGDGPYVGQCSSNFKEGSQYSFPREAMCPPGVAPGQAAGCAWGEAVPLRTVRASCVMEERGLLEVCAREFGHAPFLESKRIFEAAFASADPAKGGCPDAVADDLATATLII